MKVSLPLAFLLLALSAHPATSRNPETNSILRSSSNGRGGFQSRPRPELTNRRRSKEPQPLPPPPSNPATRPISRQSTIVFGMLLALNSGYINGLCLSALLTPTVKQAGAAVTGAWTNSALAFASDDFDRYLFNVQSILSYMGGSLISGFLNPNPPPPFHVHVPSTRLILLLASLIMGVSRRVAQSYDGVERSVDDSHNFIFYAAVACGMQNSLTSTFTGNLVRSSHFSGITSDMGTFLGQILQGNGQNVGKLRVFVMLAGAFWMGGVASYDLGKTLGSDALLVSAGLYLLLGLGVTFL